ncbi:MAG TPA: transposase [Streptosporangiaceae bacterium]
MKQSGVGREGGHEGYFVATVGGANLEVIKRYVENQRNS